jgi:hypothetical protein
MVGKVPQRSASIESARIGEEMEQMLWTFARALSHSARRKTFDGYAWSVLEKCNLVWGMFQRRLPALAIK